MVKDFLRSIEAMVRVDKFFAIGDEIVYVREVPPGITPCEGITSAAQEKGQGISACLRRERFSRTVCTT